MTYKQDDLDRWAEKVRACLAEVGFVDGENVTITTNTETGLFVNYDLLTRPPREVLWKARELAEIEWPLCLAHFTEPSGYNDCLADRRLMRDCTVGDHPASRE